MNTDHYEQLATGAALADDDADAPVVRVIPIQEGERVRGHRPDDADETPAIWDREALQDAVQQGRLGHPDGSPTKIVKGRSGENPHWEMDEQVPPDDILGQIERWEYEDGVGPVGYAQLADESIADRIELGLLDISGDWFRRLGEYDQARDGKPVEEVLALPRVTVVDRGAAGGARIEPATVEALAAPDGLLEQHQDVGDAVRWESDAGGDREPDDVRYGVVVDGLQDEAEDQVLVAVYQPDEDRESWEARGEQNPMQEDNLERVGPDGVESLPAISQVVDQGSEQQAAGSPSDGGPDSPEGSSSSTQQPDSTHPHMDPDELQEQLADVKSERDSLETEKERLESDLEDTRERLAEADESIDEDTPIAQVVDDVLEEKEQLAEEVGDLEEEVGPVRELLAEIATADSPLDPEKVAQDNTAKDLIDQLAENAEEDDEDGPSYAEQVREQLGQAPSPRGDSGDGGDTLDDEDLEQAEQLGEAVMTVSDLRRMDQNDMSAREYLSEHKGVDPAEFESERGLREAMARAQADGQAAANGGDA